MTNIPPQPGTPFPPQGNPPYTQSAPQAPTSGLALTAMILGIVSLPLMCLFGIGIIPAILAIIFGAIALSKAKGNPMAFGGIGFAIAGIVIGALGALLIVPLLIAILLPSLGKARELSNRAACAANCTGFVKACVVYANDSGGVYPCVPAPISLGTYRYDVGVVGTKTTLGDALNEMEGSGTPYQGNVPGNVLASMWITVLTNQVAPKGFICKSDGAVTGPAPLMSGSNFMSTFQSANQVSYSIAYPWASATVTSARGNAGAAGGWWKDDTNAAQPCISDMAPMNGTGSPARLTTTIQTNKKAWNSGNHNGDGQNVAYGDAHCEWQTNPICGDSLLTGTDNIFTTNNASGGGGGHGLSANGTIIMPARFDASPYDIIMVPVRNLNTNGF